MKNLYRRQRQQYVFAVLLSVFAVVNLLFFLILYQPARSEYYRLQDSIQKLRVEVQANRQSMARLEKLNAQLETSAQDRHLLYTTHFIPRTAGWSEILPQLDSMVRRAEVKNTRKNYTIDEIAQYGLFSVKIRVPVTGAYSNIVNFIRDIEDSDTLFIVDSIDLRGNSESVEVPEISLALNLETFFYQ